MPYPMQNSEGDKREKVSFFELATLSSEVYFAVVFWVIMKSVTCYLQIEHNFSICYFGKVPTLGEGEHRYIEEAISGYIFQDQHLLTTMKLGTGKLRTFHACTCYP